MENIANLRSRLLEILREKSVERGSFQLRSGKQSDYYVDGKQTSLDAEGSYLIGKVLFERIEALEAFPQGVGGVTLGADPIVTAVSLVSHLEGKPKHEAEELAAETLTAGGLVDGQTSKPEDGQRIARQLLPSGGWKVVDLDVSGSHRRKPQDGISVDRDVRDAQVVLELVLAGEPVEEAIEVGIAGLEPRSIVSLSECPNLHRGEGRAGPRWASPSRSPSRARRPTCG